MTGFIVPFQTPEGIAKIACDLVADPDRLRQLSDNARKRVEELFSMEKMVRAHEEAYLRLLEEKRASNWARLTCRA